MSFEREIRKWLELSIYSGVPSNVKGYSFNLNEPAGIEGVKFGIELIGSGEFNMDDDDWACDEIWEPSQRQINIPQEYSGDNWENCQKTIAKLLSKILNEGGIIEKSLKSSHGIGLGFVDGDLEILWSS